MSLLKYAIDYRMHTFTFLKKILELVCKLFREKIAIFYSSIKIHNCILIFPFNILKNNVSKSEIVFVFLLKKSNAVEPLR